MTFAGVNHLAGCSWVCAHAGKVLADQLTGTVCIVDANLGAPSWHEHFRFNNGAGFTETVKGTDPMHEYARRSYGPGARVVAALDWRSSQRHRR